MKNKIFLILVFSVCTSCCYSQLKPKPQKFRVYAVSRNIPFTTAFLNSEIAGFSNKEKLDSVFNALLKRYPNGKVSVLERIYNSAGYVKTYEYAKNNFGKSTDVTSLVTKGSFSYRVFTLVDLNEIFKDTLAVLDPLKITCTDTANMDKLSLVIKDNLAPKDRYISIPFVNNQLIFLLSDEMFKKKTLEVFIISPDFPNRRFGKCFIKILDDEEKDDLKGFYNTLIASGFESAYAQELTRDYSKKRHGNMYPPNLEGFLNGI